MQVFTVKNTCQLYVINDKVHYFLACISGETCYWNQVYWIGNKNETFYKENEEDFSFGYVESHLLEVCKDTDEIKDAIDTVVAFKEKMKKFDDLLKWKSILF